MTSRQTALSQTNTDTPGTALEIDFDSEGGRMVYRLFEQFQAIATNSRERFVPTLANLQRWKWHIDQAILRQGTSLTRIEYKEDAEAEAYARARAFDTFADMPDYMQRAFLQIAGCFAPRRCFATGSRVNGRYAESWSGDEVRAMRRRLKQREKVSDYDVYVEGITPAELRSISTQAKRKDEMPDNADIQNYLPPQTPMIEVPGWDFSRLPDSEHEAVIELLKKDNVGALMQMHNKYQLSAYTYCCEENAVRRWFRHGVESGQIKVKGGCG